MGDGEWFNESITSAEGLQPLGLSDKNIDFNYQSQGILCDYYGNGNNMLSTSSPKIWTTKSTKNDIELSHRLH